MCVAQALVARWRSQLEEWESLQLRDVINQVLDVEQMLLETRQLLPQWQTEMQERWREQLNACKELQLLGRSVLHLETHIKFAAVDFRFYLLRPAWVLSLTGTQRGDDLTADGIQAAVAFFAAAVESSTTAFDVEQSKLAMLSQHFRAKMDKLVRLSSMPYCLQMFDAVHHDTRRVISEMLFEIQGDKVDAETIPTPWLKTSGPKTWPSLKAALFECADLRHRGIVVSTGARAVTVHALGAYAPSTNLEAPTVLTIWHSESRSIVAQVTVPPYKVTSLVDAHSLKRAATAQAESASEPNVSLEDGLDAFMRAWSRHPNDERKSPQDVAVTVAPAVDSPTAVDPNCSVSELVDVAHDHDWVYQVLPQHDVELQPNTRYIFTRYDAIDATVSGVDADIDTDCTSAGGTAGALWSMQSELLFPLGSCSAIPALGAFPSSVDSESPTHRRGLINFIGAPAGVFADGVGGKLYLQQESVPSLKSPVAQQGHMLIRAISVQQAYPDADADGVASEPSSASVEPVVFFDNSAPAASVTASASAASDVEMSQLTGIRISSNPIINTSVAETAASPALVVLHEATAVADAVPASQSPVTMSLRPWLRSALPGAAQRHFHMPPASVSASMAVATPSLPPVMSASEISALPSSDSASPSTIESVVESPTLTPAAASAPTAVWREQRDPETHRVFYLNGTTQERTWIKPEDVVIALEPAAAQTFVAAPVESVVFELPALSALATNDPPVLVSFAPPQAAADVQVAPAASAVTVGVAFTVGDHPLRVRGLGRAACSFAGGCVLRVIEGLSQHVIGEAVVPPVADTASGLDGLAPVIAQGVEAYQYAHLSSYGRRAPVPLVLMPHTMYHFTCTGDVAVHWPAAAALPLAEVGRIVDADLMQLDGRLVFDGGVSVATKGLHVVGVDADPAAALGLGLTMQVTREYVSQIGANGVEY